MSTPTEDCPLCFGTRTVKPPEQPADVAHWGPAGDASICPADAQWANRDPGLWPHPRA